MQNDDEILENSEDTSVALNEYFLSVFTHEILNMLPDTDQVFRGREDERLMNLNVTSQQVIQEIDKLRHRLHYT